MKKVLIISYYWPPNGGTGVQRWIHFAKYLKDLNWDVTIFTPINSESVVDDHALLQRVKEIKVVHSHIWEPFNIYRKLTGKKKSQRIQTGFLQEQKKSSKLEKLSLWIRANFFVPDAKMMWIKPAIKEILKLQKTEKFTHIISTGPPHSTHLIACGIKNQTNIKWLADFRDPWTNIDWFHKLPFTQNTIGKHQRLEKRVLDNADAVVAVTYRMAEEFSAISKKKTHVITNGFAQEDFINFKSKLGDKLVVFHHGSLNADRNPIKFWEFLGNCVKNDDIWRLHLEIQLIGSVDSTVIKSLEKNDLKEFLSIKSFIPHKQVIDALSHATLCLMPLNNTPNAKGIMPNKLYEYLGSGKPMVMIGPKDGDAALAVQGIENCCVFDFEEEIDKNIVLSCIEKGKISNDLSKFNRYNLALEIDALLNSM